MWLTKPQTDQKQRLVIPINKECFDCDPDPVVEISFELLYYLQPQFAIHYTNAGTICKSEMLI